MKRFLFCFLSILLTISLFSCSKKEEISDTLTCAEIAKKAEENDMKSGKVSEAVLKRSVIKAVNKQEKQNMVAKTAVGLDAGLFVQEEMTGVMAVSCTSLSGSEEGLAALAVKRSCNSLAASGANPAANPR